MAFLNKYRKILFSVLVFLASSHGYCADQAIKNPLIASQTLQGRDLDGDVSNGYEAYYDLALDLSWLADANYAKTSKFNATGLLAWDEANQWSSSLMLYGISNWRLPTLVDTGEPGCGYENGGPDCGTSILLENSELAHLYYVTLGNTPGPDPISDVPAVMLTKKFGPFINVQSENYWTNVQYPFFGGTTAWIFSPLFGSQGFDAKSIAQGSWLVHKGDILLAVHEPESFILCVFGLISTASLTRRSTRTGRSFPDFFKN
jgi:hypothetical protein